MRKAVIVVAAALALAGCGPSGPAPAAGSNWFQTFYQEHLACESTGFFTPVWAADAGGSGTHIYYTVQITGTSGYDLRVMDDQGGDDRLLFSKAAAPSLSPDGAQLLYLDTSAATPGGSPRSLLDLRTGQARSLGYLGDAPGWSPDGRMVVYSLLDPAIPLQLLDLATGQSRDLYPADGAAHGDRLPLWSPDGGTIAFMSSRDRPDARIFLVGPDGRDLRPLPGQDGRLCPPVGGSVTPPAYNAPAAWSPDGSRLAYTTCSDTTLVAASPGGETPDWTYVTTTVLKASWSPDGSHILLIVNDRTTYGVLIVGGADGSGMTRIGGHITDAAWSPDGARIVTVDQTSAPDINLFTMAVDGSDVRQLTHTSPSSRICPH